MDYNFDLKIFRRLMEGGNVFKDENKQPVTVRINKEDIAPSLKMIEKVLGFKLDNWLGTTGKKASSGDIDVAVDATKYDRKEIANQLRAWVKSQGLNPKDWVALSGTNVHFKLPIAGHDDEYAQLDLMFGNPEFMAWSMRGEPGEYKGIHRHILMASIAKAGGMKWSYLNGLVDRATDKVISQDPQQIASKLLPGATVKDLSSVESILNFIYKKYKNDPKKIEALIGEAAATLAEHYGVQLPMPNAPAVNENNDSDEYFLARLRDKIIEAGSDVLFEGALLEGARIEHPEDLVFTSGSDGIIQGMRALQGMTGKEKEVTIKWDGKPAIIFGRDEMGNFILTDKSGFTAKGYDGLAKSPADIERIMSMRKGDRGDLVAMYTKLFPLLDKVIPANFRGFVFGDLLYSDTPPNNGGQVVFTPNTVTYAVDLDSELGKRIAQSEVGIAAHTFIDGVGGATHPISHIADKLDTIKQVVILDPYFKEQPSVKLSPSHAKKLKAVLTHANEIDALFNPDTLRMLKITDLPALMKRYINSKVSEGNFNNLASGFVKWLPSFTTDAKLPRMKQHMAEHKQGVAAVFQSFVILTQAKSEIVSQLDQQSGPVHASIEGEHGHEGYVAKTGGGSVKFVDRMRFSRANFAKNA